MKHIFLVFLCTFVFLPLAFASGNEEKTGVGGNHTPHPPHDHHEPHHLKYLKDTDSRRKKQKHVDVQVDSLH